MNVVWLQSNGFEETVQVNELEEMQALVSGLIQVVSSGDYCMVLNEEGKLQNLPINEIATVIAREDQTEWLADECLKHDRKIYILGKSFKPETNITTGSPSILLYNILTEKGADVDILDPHIDGKESFLSKFLTAEENSLFFIGTQHDAFRNLEFPTGSIVMDPFRYMPDIEGSTLIKIGNNA